MIRHIVLFQFRSDVDASTRQRVATQFKERIMALPAKLSIIRDLEVGFNANPAECWDICLNSSFDSQEDVATYSNFPEHQDAAKELKLYLSGRSCVDYQV